MTDSDNELKVAKKVTLKKFVAGHMHDQVGKISIRDHDRCVWIYVDAYTTQSNLYLQQKLVNRSLNSYRLPIFITLVR